MKESSIKEKDKKERATKEQIKINHRIVWSYKFYKRLPLKAT